MERQQARREQHGTHSGNELDLTNTLGQGAVEEGLREHGVGPVIRGESTAVLQNLWQWR